MLGRIEIPVDRRKLQGLHSIDTLCSQVEPDHPVRGDFEDLVCVTRNTSCYTVLKVLPKDFGGSESMCTLLHTRRCGGTLQIFMHVAKKCTN